MPSFILNFSSFKFVIRITPLDGHNKARNGLWKYYEYYLPVWCRICQRQRPLLKLKSLAERPKTEPEMSGGKQSYIRTQTKLLITASLIRHIYVCVLHVRESDAQGARPTAAVNNRLDHHNLDPEHFSWWRLHSRFHKSDVSKQSRSRLISHEERTRAMPNSF